jgi:hypothetical protein
MERKPIPCKSLAQYAEDPLGIEHVLERHDGIVSEADKASHLSIIRRITPSVTRWSRKSRS